MKKDQQNNLRINISEKKEYFAWLPNCIVYDWGLSANAIAVALYLNGKPAGWQVRPFDLRAHFNWGDHTWRKASKELKGHALLREEITQRGTKLWFELPDINLTIIKSATVDSRGPRIPDRRKSTPLSYKDLPKKDLINNNNICSSGNKTNKTNKANKANKRGVNAAFERLWEYYPIKKGKQRAYTVFSKLTQGKSQEELEELTKTIWDGMVGLLQERRWLQEAREHEKMTIFIPDLPNGSTWFSQTRWTDEYEMDAEKFLAKVRAGNRR